MGQIIAAALLVASILFLAGCAAQESREGQEASGQDGALEQSSEAEIWEISSAAESSGEPENDDSDLPELVRWENNSYVVYTQMEELVKTGKYYYPDSADGYYQGICIRNNENSLYMGTTLGLYVETPDNLIKIEYAREQRYEDGGPWLFWIMDDFRFFYQTPGRINLFFSAYDGGGNAMNSCILAVDVENAELAAFHEMRGSIYDMQLVDDTFYVLLASYDHNENYELLLVSKDELEILESYKGTIVDEDDPQDGYGWDISVTGFELTEDGACIQYFAHKTGKEKVHFITIDS